jgi:protein ImuB
VQWIALHFPNLPLEALTRSLATPEPQAVAEHSAANHQRVVACDGKACARGVRPGITVSAARALAHDLVVRPRDPAEETEALLGLAGWAAQFTPSVAHELPDALVLEVSGSLKLFGGVDRIRARLVEGCALMGFTARIACAPTARGAAWLARAGVEQCIEHADALGPVLAALPLAIAVREAETLEALHAIGARTVGELAALPRDGLARRFGQPLLDDLDRARGRLADPRAFYVPPAKFHARIELPAEVTQAESLLFAARRLFVQLEGFLAARAGGVRRLELRLFHREARMTLVPIGLVAPSRDASHFTLLARERLGTVALAEPVRALALGADDIVPLAGEPLALFAGESGRPEDWQRLVERLRARLGAASVHGVLIAAEHRPEYASRACELAPAPGKETREGGRAGLRPFWLLAAPRPIEEIGAVPHYGGPLKLVAGPERIESGWWDGEEVARDYFVAQTPEHALVWIYRARGTGGGWFLHGLFA